MKRKFRFTASKWQKHRCLYIFYAWNELFVAGTVNSPERHGAAAQNRTEASSTKRNLSIDCGREATTAAITPVRVDFENLQWAMCPQCALPICRWKFSVYTSISKWGPGLYRNRTSKGPLQKCKFLQLLFLRRLFWHTCGLGLKHLGPRCNFLPHFAGTSNFPVWFYELRLSIGNLYSWRCCNQAACDRCLDLYLHWLLSWAATEGSYEYIE